MFTDNCQYSDYTDCPWRKPASCRCQYNGNLQVIAEKLKKKIRKGHVAGLQLDVNKRYMYNPQD